MEYTPPLIIAKKMDTPAIIQLPADHLISNQLLTDRKIYLWGQVDDNSAKAIVQQLVYLEATQPGIPIHMYLNCPGGMVTAGFAMYDMMQAISSPVYTYCIGFAASMGANLLSGGEKGHRYIYPYAEVMIHQPSMGNLQGNSADIEINAKQLIRTKHITAELLAKNCGQTKERILQDFDRDYWMNAEEAITYGIVDKIAV